MYVGGLVPWQQLPCLPSGANGSRQHGRTNARMSQPTLRRLIYSVHELIHVAHRDVFSHYRRRNIRKNLRKDDISNYTEIARSKTNRKLKDEDCKN